MRKILITGGSGLLGCFITDLLLKQKFEVVHLSTRKNYSPPKGVTSFYWKPKKSIIEENALEGVDTVIHLAGASVAGDRWTSSRKKEILNSRIQGTKLIVESIKNTKVRSLIGASAIGYYGSRGQDELSEDAANGSDFLANVCDVWEKKYLLKSSKEIRKVIFRIGIVLANEGGALPEMKQTLPLFIGVLGNGKQIYSWIHIADLAELFIQAVNEVAMEGVYNAVAPKPVSQKKIAQEIARVNNVFTVPTPALSLKLILGEMSQMVLMSQNCSAQKVLNSGFKFKFPKIGEAMDDLHEN